MKNYIKNKYPKIFLLIKNIYLKFYQSRVGDYFFYYFNKYILRQEIYFPSVERFASTWKNQLEGKKDQSYTNWRGDKQLKKQNLREIRKILNAKSKEHKCILDIGSYDGYFVKDYFDFEKIICADVFQESGNFINKEYGYHNDLSFIEINGYDLTDIDESSADYIFCIDSLSRVPTITIETYLKDLHRILSKERERKGEIFIHLPKNNISNKRSGMTIIPKRKVLKLLQKDFESIQFRDDLDEMGYCVFAKIKN